MTHCKTCIEFIPETDQEKLDSGTGGKCKASYYYNNENRKFELKIPVHIVESKSKSMFCPLGD